MRYVFLALLSVSVVVTTAAFAEIRQSDLDKKVVVTEEAALLSQADAVSLYLSSDRVAFAPRLTKAGIIEVEVTVLAPDLIANKGKLREFVERLVGTFVSVLKERLPVYAPVVAKRFDSERDIVFVVNSGAARTPVGIFKGGMWQEGIEATSTMATSTATDELIEARALESKEASGAVGRKGCRCPARR